MGTITELSDAELADEITSWAGRIAAAEARLLAMIGEFDQREAWAGVGILSCAHWLTAIIRVTMRENETDYLDMAKRSTPAQLERIARVCAGRSRPRRTRPTRSRPPTRCRSGAPTTPTAPSC